MFSLVDPFMHLMRVNNEQDRAIRAAGCGLRPIPVARTFTHTSLAPVWAGHSHPSGQTGGLCTGVSSSRVPRGQIWILWISPFDLFGTFTVSYIQHCYRDIDLSSCNPAGTFDLRSLLKDCANSSTIMACKAAFGILCALSLAASVRAQWDDPDGESGADGSTTPTSIEGEITIHTINVGSDAFYPNTIVANPADKVMFIFRDGNHSVIQSLYGWPCQPQAAVTGEEGFHSGFFPITDSDATSPTWNLTVTNNTDPIFFYCGAPGSCYGKGMLGAINGNSETNVSAQIELAKASRYGLQFGDSMAPAASASMTALAAEVLAEIEEHSHGLSTGAIVGIAVGGAAGIVLLGALLFFLRRNRKLKKQLRASQAVPAACIPPDMQQHHGHISYIPPEDPRTINKHMSPAPPYQAYNPTQEHVKGPQASPFVRSVSEYSNHTPGWSSMNPLPPQQQNSR
ncbi:hypothetical protein AC579_10284 [Pseudocercospora musae]|uniref:Phytocyanin domain-containing protein n=1 Tax=Pseudocercospora musae TaxID=113226 RepID=A0A139ICH8_9PEZI|nr:hypothetical protein AC579_10284 [Pseudocercospora musae]